MDAFLVGMLTTTAVRKAIELAITDLWRKLYGRVTREDKRQIEKAADKMVQAATMDDVRRYDRKVLAIERGVKSKRLPVTAMKFSSGRYRNRLGIRSKKLSTRLTARSRRTALAGKSVKDTIRKGKEIPPSRRRPSRVYVSPACYNSSSFRTRSSRKVLSLSLSNAPRYSWPLLPLRLRASKTKRCVTVPSLSEYSRKHKRDGESSSVHTISSSRKFGG